MEDCRSYSIDINSDYNTVMVMDECAFKFRRSIMTRNVLKLGDEEFNSSGLQQKHNS